MEENPAPWTNVGQVFLLPLGEHPVTPWVNESDALCVGTCPGLAGLGSWSGSGWFIFPQLQTTVGVFS